MVGEGFKSYAPRLAAFVVVQIFVLHADFSLCEFFISDNEVRKGAARLFCLKQRCNPAATDVATFAKTLRAVQLKKSMPGIARSGAASGQRLRCQ
jgi:hypothetical protein